MVDARVIDGLGTFGAFRRFSALTPAFAAELERLGYGAIWVGGSPDGDLRVIEDYLDATTTIMVATGIVNIWKDAPELVAASFHRIEQRHPGRFLLGIGVGHPEATGARYTKPYDALVAYLDALDEAHVPVDRRVLAALGPRVLKLAAERTAGAHPYLVTPEHTPPRARDRRPGRPARARTARRPGRRPGTGPGNRPSDRREAVSRPVQLHAQPALARLHRRGSRRWWQRPADRRTGRLRRPGSRRGRSDQTHRGRREPRRRQSHHRSR